VFLTCLRICEISQNFSRLELGTVVSEYPNQLIEEFDIPTPLPMHVTG